MDSESEPNPDQTDLVDYVDHESTAETPSNGEDGPPMTEVPEGEYEEPEDFQQAMDRLEDLARRLESGELPLEEAMNSYREGQRLIEYCQERLEEAEMVIEEVQEDEDEVRIEPKEDEE